MSTITLSTEQLNALIAQAVALAVGQAKAPKGTPKHMIPGASAAMSERSIANAVATVKAFKKRGFKESDIQPRVTVMTYNRWLAEGRKVKAGEQAVKVRNLRLFHVSQTEAISPEEKAEALAKMQAAIDAHNAKKAGTAQATA